MRVEHDPSKAPVTTTCRARTVKAEIGGSAQNEKKKSSKRRKSNDKNAGSFSFDALKTSQAKKFKGVELLPGLDPMTAEKEILLFRLYGHAVRSTVVDEGVSSNVATISSSTNTTMTLINKAVRMPIYSE